MASLDELREERLRKLNILKERGLNPYPITVKRDVSIGDAVAQFTKLSKRKSITLAGRVLALRGQGAIAFFDIADSTGKIQGLLKKDELKEADRDLFIQTVDLGDFIEVKGTLFTTKRKEKTLQVKSWRMLAKSLRPLPDKWHGLQDVEERFRKRYLDTLMNAEVKDRFIMRSRIISALRAVLDKGDFLEVETPILQPLAGGALAQPFVTHHNALDIDMFLRIAPELYLKELLVGGFDKVYEIGRLFRNEGIDATHNPEFTTIEIYEAFADAEKHMVFLEKLLKNIVKKVTGGTKVSYGGTDIDFGSTFQRIPYLDLLKRYALIPNPESITREEAELKANQFGIKVAPGDTREKILDNIYKKTARPKIMQPTYIIDYPVAFSPLAKRKENRSDLIDRYQLIIGGLEVVNAFSELNDPVDQRERFVEQEKNKATGDTEAQPKDEEYLTAMEYGMPPAGGIGMSVDRLTMILTDAHNIREVILFPTLRTKE